MHSTDIFALKDENGASNPMYNSKLPLYLIALYGHEFGLGKICTDHHAHAVQCRPKMEQLDSWNVVTFLLQ